MEAVDGLEVVMAMKECRIKLAIGVAQCLKLVIARNAIVPCEAACSWWKALYKLVLMPLEEDQLLHNLTRRLRDNLATRPFAKCL